MKRLADIDIAKGIGIILVVLGHLLSESGGVLHDWIYSFHMPLFFVLSGITLSPGRSLTKLAFRTLIPYLVWSVAATIYEIICSAQIWKSILFVNSINTLSTYGIAPFWFLPALFIGESVSVVLLRRCSQRSLYVIWIVSPLLLGHHRTITNTVLLQKEGVAVSLRYALLEP